MTSQVLQFAKLSDRDRKTVGSLPTMAECDHVELRVRRENGEVQTLSVPPSARAAVEALLGHMLRGERVAVLTE